MRGSFFLSVSDSRSGVCRGSLGPAEGWFGKPGRVLRRSDDRRHTVVSVRASRTGYKVAMKSAPRCLRLSPAFRLQRVGAADASLLKRVGQDDLPRDYGILWPTRRSHTIKILSPELAEYLEGVQAEREGLPGLEELGPAGLNLMFDGILEWREDGRWQTGAAHLPPAPSQVVDREDRGILALLEARTRPDLSPAALATFLYEYGRKPFSSRWVARVGGSTQDDFEKWIGLAARSRIHAISSRWRATRAVDSHPPPSPPSHADPPRPNAKRRRRSHWTADGVVRWIRTGGRAADRRGPVVRSGRFDARWRGARQPRRVRRARYAGRGGARPRAR